MRSVQVNVSRMNGKRVTSVVTFSPSMKMKASAMHVVCLSMSLFVCSLLFSVCNAARITVAALPSQHLNGEPPAGAVRVSGAWVHTSCRRRGTTTMCTHTQKNTADSMGTTRGVERYEHARESVHQVAWKCHAVPADVMHVGCTGRPDATPATSAMGNTHEGTRTPRDSRGGRQATRARTRRDAVSDRVGGVDMYVWCAQTRSTRPPSVRPQSIDILCPLTRTRSVGTMSPSVRASAPRHESIAHVSRPFRQETAENGTKNG